MDDQGRFKLDGDNQEGLEWILAQDTGEEDEEETNKE